MPAVPAVAGRVSRSDFKTISIKLNPPFTGDFFMNYNPSKGLNIPSLAYFASLSKPMWSVCKKELRQSFSSLTGYIAIIVFLLVNGLVLFVFEDNIFDFGYATLDRFFQLAPWILLLLIPAITMRSFSEEFKTGT